MALEICWSLYINLLTTYIIFWQKINFKFLALASVPVPENKFHCKQKCESDDTAKIKIICVIKYKYN